MSNPLFANKKKKKSFHQVKSGIGLSALHPGEESTSEEESSFITSRTARVLLAGAGFLADAYDLFVINLVLRLLRDEYPEYNETGKLHMFEGFVASAALLGSVIGQVVGGSLADIWGRKKLFVATAVFISIGSFGSACSIDHSAITIYSQIAMWRFILGLGVGGEYPLAATVTSESTSAHNRGSLMASVFSMQGFGSLLSGIIVILCLSLGFSINFTWRFALAFGSIPVLIAFPYRLRMHETETFTTHQKNIQGYKVLGEPTASEEVISTSNPVVTGGFGTNKFGKLNDLSRFNGDYSSESYENQPLNTSDSFNSVKYGASNSETPSGLKTSLKKSAPMSINLSSAVSTSSTDIESVPERERTTSDDYGHYDLSLGKSLTLNDNMMYKLGNGPTSYHHLTFAPGESISVSQLDPTLVNIAPKEPHGADIFGKLNTNPLGSLSLANELNKEKEKEKKSGLKSGLSSKLGLKSGVTDLTLLAENSTFSPKNTVKNLTSISGSYIKEKSYNAANSPFSPHKNLSSQYNQQYNQQYFNNSSSGTDSILSNQSFSTLGNTTTATITSSSISSSSSSSSSNSSSTSRLEQIKQAFYFYKYHILGTALSWFLLDIVFYANGLFNHAITSKILTSNTDDSSTPIQDARNAIIISCFAIPGYIFSIFYIEKIGRKNLQCLGFFMISFLFFLCGVFYDSLLGSDDNGKYFFLIIYALTFFFSNFGPNTTTFVIPGEIYPVQVRATAHGLSAASGKLGAAFGAYFFPFILNMNKSAEIGDEDEESTATRQGMIASMYLCSFVSILGLIITYIFIPRYDTENLIEEGEYIPEEFDCLRPPLSEIDQFEEKNGLKYSKSKKSFTSITNLTDLEMHRI